VDGETSIWRKKADRVPKVENIGTGLLIFKGKGKGSHAPAGA